MWRMSVTTFPPIVAISPAYDPVFSACFWAASAFSLSSFCPASRMMWMNRVQSSPRHSRNAVRTPVRSPIWSCTNVSTAWCADAKTSMTAAEWYASSDARSHCSFLVATAIHLRIVLRVLSTHALSTGAVLVERPLREMFLSTSWISRWSRLTLWCSLSSICSSLPSLKACSIAWSGLVCTRMWYDAMIPAMSTVSMSTSLTRHAPMVPSGSTGPNWVESSVTTMWQCFVTRLSCLDPSSPP
mmetsp:Transcript_50489/g.123130  ORF Transcript_50489/g.123130 Transcript_50489/m.123130 type:complete len:242 (+) Transcript_50489:106-831(+)